MDKQDKRTYCERNRFTGFFNDHHATIIKAYAYNENTTKSKVLLKMCKSFISKLDPDEVKIMVQRYKAEHSK